jgi:ubiquinone/menaquinone biosynthesis C-methylase UbiE
MTKVSSLSTDRPGSQWELRGFGCFRKMKKQLSSGAHQDSVVAQFTRQAVHYSQMPGHNDEEALKLLMQMAGVTGEDTVLDVACGTGIVARAFASVAKHVTGIDVTPAMLDQARASAVEIGLTNLSWQQGDIESLPFPDDSFSIVTSRYAFHHFLNPERVLAEMARVCRTGGRILIADGTPSPDRAEAYNYFEKLFDPSHARALTLEEFRRLFEDVGLPNVRFAFYKMEMELEQALSVSFPEPGDDQVIRRLFREDVGVDRLGVGAHLRNGEIHFAYPVTVLFAEK